MDLAHFRCTTTVALMGLLAGAAAPAMAQLSNGSFETPAAMQDPFMRPAFADWTEFGNSTLPNPNISQGAAIDGDLVQTGDFNAVVFGGFNSPFNASVLLQPLPVPVQVDDVIDASIWAGQLAADPLILGNFMVMNVEFRDASNSFIEFVSVTIVDEFSATDSLIEYPTQAIAPDGATQCQVAFVFVQEDPILGTGSAHIDDASLELTGVDSSFQNASFETEAGNCCVTRAMSQWAEIGRSTMSNNIQRSGELVRTGLVSAFMFGQFPGPNVFNTTAIYQSQPCQEGDQVDAEVWAAHFAGDPLMAGNIGFVNLEFYDASDMLIGSVVANEFFDEMQPTNTWVLGQTSAVAPAGAARVRMVCGLNQPNDGAGGIYFDDAVFAVTPGAPACCVGNGGKESPGQVNFADITAVLGNWLVDYGAGNTGPGDSNCDGLVNFADVTATLGNWLNACP